MERAGGGPVEVHQLFSFLCFNLEAVKLAPVHKQGEVIAEPHQSYLFKTEP